LGEGVALSFCLVCGGSHTKALDCPGDLAATGPERHGWRVAVETPFGIEAYGVLIAPSSDRWRARVVTYPNVLWTAPGGAVALKFVGNTPQEAESQAVAFVEGHIKSRGYLRRDALDVPTVSRFGAEARPGAPVVAGPALRKLRAIPVRFGVGPTLFAAMTGNLSVSGLFVTTLAPFDPGTAVRVQIDLETGPTGLKGEVMWNRRRIVLGRPVGMGVQLIAPPVPYREFVVELP
jgi:hypothetical protein